LPLWLCRPMCVCIATWQHLATAGAYRIDSYTLVTFVSGRTSHGWTGRPPARTLSRGSRVFHRPSRCLPQPLVYYPSRPPFDRRPSLPGLLPAGWPTHTGSTSVDMDIFSSATLPSLSSRRKARWTAGCCCSRCVLWSDSMFLPQDFVARVKISEIGFGFASFILGLL